MGTEVEAEVSAARRIRPAGTANRRANTPVTILNVTAMDCILVFMTFMNASR